MPALMPFWSPSGTLSSLFPVRIEENPVFINTQVNRGKALYEGNIYIGFRLYVEIQKEVLSPLGYGLSYTTVELNELAITGKGDNKNLVMAVSAKNTGDCDGAEIVKAYVSPEFQTARRSPRELKGLTKMQVVSGGTATSRIEVEKKYT